MNAALDYEAERRGREARELREAAHLKITVRGVARLLGARYLDEESEQRGHTLELAPTVQLWARRDWRNKAMIHWGVRCPKASAHAPSVCTALARSPQAIAADLRRRLVPAAHAACKAAITAAALEKDREHARRARVAELETVFGPLRTGHDGWHYAEGFQIRHGELLGGDHHARLCAEIRVHSWACLMMIAKLVAEDARVAAAREAAQP